MNIAIFLEISSIISDLNIFTTLQLEANFVKTLCRLYNPLKTLDLPPNTKSKTNPVG